MALIKCPKCGKEFSDRAACCPQCGISKGEALLIIQKREEEIRLANEREAAERERQRQEYFAEQERIRKEREAKEEEEARIRAEKRAEWWRRNKKKIWISVSVVVVIIIAFVAFLVISDVVKAKQLDQRIESIFAEGDSCVAAYNFVKADSVYAQVLELKSDDSTRVRVLKKQQEIKTAKQNAEKEYKALLSKLRVLLDADDNEFNQFSNDCLDKMIKIYPNREETRYYRSLRGDDEADINGTKEASSGDVGAVDSFAWIYGTWHCDTPYGKMKVILKKDGRMYDGVNDKWYNYKIEEGRIIEQCEGYISTYNIDEDNKRFDAGEPGVWYYKVSE